MISSGAVPLPIDFDSGRPSPSSVQPCVAQPRNGERVAQSHADQQRALEPAAILVAAFHIEIGGPAKAVFFA